VDNRSTSAVTDREVTATSRHRADPVERPRQGARAPRFRVLPVGGPALV